MGRWVKAHSRHTDELGNVREACNGLCACCGEEVETDLHLFKCRFYEQEVATYREKLTEEFREKEGFEIIDDCFETNKLEKLV